MTTIQRDDFDPTRKELAIAWSGDRDLGDHELRRLGRIEDFKLSRLGGAVFPEGYVVESGVPVVAPVTNLAYPSNGFAAWEDVDGLVVTAGYAPDRAGVVGAATRLVGAAGQASRLDLDLSVLSAGAGGPDRAMFVSNRMVFSLDILGDGVASMRLAIWDGVTEHTATHVPTTTWARYAVVRERPASEALPDTLVLRIYPGLAPLSGSIVVAHAQLEALPEGLLLVPSVYVPTTTAPVTAPGNRVSIGASLVYAGGLPRPVPAATLTFDPAKVTGVDTLYAELAERYILAMVDADLDNPVTGRPGNDSVREETRWVTTDTTNPVVPADVLATNPQYRSRLAVPVYQFDRATNTLSEVAKYSKVAVDDTLGLLPGDRITPRSIPEDRLDVKATEGQSGLLAATARRMRNLSGGFVVPQVGTTPTITQNMGVTTKVQLKVDPLDGYTPDGRAHYLDTPQVVEAPLQASTALREDEGHTYYATYTSYTLAKQPVVAIEEVAGYYEVTRTITRGAAAHGADALPDTPVFEIVEVKQGATVYTPPSAGVAGDYMQVGDSISWASEGGGPAVGAVYLNPVRVATTAALPANTRSGNVLTASANGSLPAVDGVALAVGERVLVRNEVNGAHNGIYTVTALGGTGAAWSLTRAADADTGAELPPGIAVSATEGTANGGASFALVASDPVTVNTTVLAWARASREPAAGSSYLVRYRYRRVWSPSEYTFTSTGLTFNADAPKPVEPLPFSVSYRYGQDRIDLVLIGGGGLRLEQGVPSDNPTPYTLATDELPLWEVRVGYAQAAVTFRPRFTVGVPMAGLMAMQEQIDRLAYNVAQLSASSSLRDRLGTLKASITDPFLDARQIDLYHPAAVAAASLARVAEGRLKMARTGYPAAGTPAILATIAGSGAATTSMALRLRGSWAGLPFTLGTPASLGNHQYSTSVSVNPYSNADPIPAVLTVSAVVWGSPRASFDAALTITGTKFQPNEDGIVIAADGVTIATVTANARGEFYTTVTRTWNASTIVTATGPIGFASQPINGSVQWVRTDPAAQTFATEVPIDIAGVDLYFTAKDTSASPKDVVVGLRRVLVGFPTQEMIPVTVKTLKANEIAVNGTATRVEFDFPYSMAAGEALALVVASESPAYRLQVAQLGKTNLGVGGGTITRNAFGGGVLLLSSDNRTWSAVQDQDLRFQILSADYTTATRRELYFEVKAYPDGITSFEFEAPHVVTSGATLQWEYSTNPTAAAPTWTPFTPGFPGPVNEVRLGAVATSLQVRAWAQTAVPVAGRFVAGVAIETSKCSLRAYRPATASVYVQVQTPLLASTTTAKAFGKSLLPAGTQVQAYASNDDGTTWVEGTLASSRALADGLTEQEWSFTFASAGTAFRGRLDLVGTATASPEVEEISFVVT
jgi:hypothetical protein